MTFAVKMTVIDHLTYTAEIEAPDFMEAIAVLDEQRVRWGDPVASHQERGPFYYLKWECQAVDSYSPYITHRYIPVS